VSRSAKSLRIVAFLVLAFCASLSARATETATAIFAGGCFWCEESAFEGLPGVISSTSGYTGGHTTNPSYEEVSSGTTGHAESAKIVYDPQKITYAKLLDVYWHNIDPFDAGGQFCDRGSQYRSAIFYPDDAQKKEAAASKKKLEEDPRFHGKIATQIVAASAFYPAEEYHQDYCKKKPVSYEAYRFGCRRDARLKAVWGDAAGGHK
jgi:peptide-methionine (S)-S-oxide reductase